ncbi:MAG: cytochrome C oxidase subunit IV family protein [Byssovorax sp.]
MANKKKNKGAEKAAVKKAEEATKPEDEADEAAAAREAQDEGDEAAHAPAAHGGAGAHAAHADHAPNRKEYMVIFGLLALLTILEVGVAKVPGISKGLMASALMLLALTKAALVGLFFMHLKHETKFLRYQVALPMAAPALYAIVLMAEAAWRLTR